jgi:carbonic anhydrase
MKKLINYSLMLALPMFFASCASSTADESAQMETVAIAMDADIVTAEEQAKMTPAFVLADLKEGNKKFVSNDLTPMDYTQQVTKSASGQYPKAVVLSCLDSRIPVEAVFNQGIGDLFVGRVAGNFVNEDMLGSMEFGCKVAGSKLIVVMGHESCGAVKAAIDRVELGNITPMLTKITPAVDASQDFEGEKTSKNSEFVTHVSKENVVNTIATIRAQSPILKEMEDAGAIAIVGAIYDMDSGEVTFFE